MGDNAARLIEGFFVAWLQGTDTGREQIERFGLDEAVDNLFELLNAGLIKIEGDADVLTGITPCSPPAPPAQKMRRPKRHDA